MSVIVGVDLGDRKIGVATGDSVTGIVTPLVTLRRGTPEHDARSLERIALERGAERFVVGLPLHSDGRESDQSRKTRAWAESVTAILGRPLTFRDERGTSASARAAVGRPPRGRSGGPPSSAARRSWRARVDRVAAAAIVQAELDAGALSESPPAEHDRPIDPGEAAR